MFRVGNEDLSGDMIRPGVLVRTKAFTGNTKDLSIIAAAQTRLFGREHTIRSEKNHFHVGCSSSHSSIFILLQFYARCGNKSCQESEKLTGFVLAGDFTFHRENRVLIPRLLFGY